MPLADRLACRRHTAVWREDRDRSRGALRGPRPATRCDTYARLIALLDEHGARYRLIDHAPEGRTEPVSAMRGYPPAQAAKRIVVLVKLGKNVTRYVPAVIPGDARLDRSIALRTSDYVRLARPRLARLREPA